MASRTLTPSAKAFGKFLKDNGLGPVEAARALGVTHPAIIGWCGGTRRPGATNRERIRIWTRGLVTEDGWKRPKELRSVEPFTPKGETEAA